MKCGFSPKIFFKTSKSPKFSFGTNKKAVSGFRYSKN
jgi:hypothetical protein